MRRSRLTAQCIAADLAALEDAGDLTGLIKLLRTAVAVDRRIFTEPRVKAWCARRWRFLFVREAVEDAVALQAASCFRDSRPARQRIAERFLFHDAQASWQDDQPRPPVPRFSDMTLLVCPGLLNGLLPAREFLENLPRVEHRYHGLRVLRSESHPARSCAANVADIVRAADCGMGSDATARLIPNNEARRPRDFFALAYSKGAPDLLTTLVSQPDLKSRIRCVFTWAGAIGGSPVADDVAAKLKSLGLEEDAAAWSLTLKGFARSLLGASGAARRRVEEFDSAGAIRDLTTGVRQKYLAEHSALIDTFNIPMFTFRGATTVREIPLSQRRGFRLIARTDPENDMQVGGGAAKLPFPMATELAVLHGHHWDLAYPSFVKRRWFNKTYHPFPKTAAVTAMVQLAAELGLID